MERDIVFDSCLEQEEKRYLIGLHLVMDLNVSVSQVAARHNDSQMALKLVSALLPSVWLPPDCMVHQQVEMKTTVYAYTQTREKAATQSQWKLKI